VISSLSVSAQRVLHNAGLAYQEHSGQFGNSSLMGLVYSPQLLFVKTNYAFGISSPMQISTSVSSARSANPLNFELPAMAELSYLPDFLEAKPEHFSVFAGVGISRVYSLMNLLPDLPRSFDLMHASLGIRVAPWQRPMEMRFTYSRPVGDFSNMTTERIGLSICTTLFDR